MELYQAIVKMEQDGSGDGVLQVCLHNLVWYSLLRTCLSSFSTVNFRFVLIASSQILMS
jgi:hypothetical protein